MEHNRAALALAGIVGQQSGGSSALSLPGTARLSDEGFQILNQLCKQMQAYYPNQEFAEETIEGYQFDMERLALKYGLDRLTEVLLDLRIQPGRTFFPHPSEIAQCLEDILANERSEYLKAHPYVPDLVCDHISPGWKLTMAGLVRCQCWKLWKGIQPTQDRKTTAAGE